MKGISSIKVILFVYGNKISQLEEVSFPIMIDLEDGVPLAEKEKARDDAISYLKKRSSFQGVRCVRINGLSTKEGLNDILAFTGQRIFPDVLCIPKVEHPSELVFLDSYFASQEIPYIVFIETALGLSRAVDILAASPNVAGVIFGKGDLSKDLGCDGSFESLLVARSLLVQAASIYKLPIFDAPYMQDDQAGLFEESKKVKALGFTGKVAMNKDQIPSINQIFH